MPDNVVHRPNLLLILTDQQSATMMSCAGNPHLHTPAMDSLAASGVRFDRAYCTDPVCAPSRFSLMTGRMPGEIGLRSDDDSAVEFMPAHISRAGLGRRMKEAGYDAVYGGKVHLPGLDVFDLGFDVISTDERDGLAGACADYLREERTRPFLLVASFVNPHDICYMAIRHFMQTEQERALVERGGKELAALDEALALPQGVGEDEFYERICPQLPPNFEPQTDEPEAIRRLLARRPFREKARRQWTERQWRLHRWAYARLTERVDRQIGVVLDALRESGRAKDTVVVFTSDHGDMDSAHRMEHKTAFYEEACRVPLIISCPGVTLPGAVEGRRLVTNGLDLAPTLCDYAEAEPPEGLRGRSLRPLAEGRPVWSWRECVPVESEIGRMVVTSRHKYMLYDDGASREQLIDLAHDPGEMRNAAGDEAKQTVLAEHRDLFAEKVGPELLP